MADNVMTFRLVVKEVALEAGVHATFMPKPLAGVQGSGMHTHFSLFEGDTNAFYDPGDERDLSKVGAGFIAGLLRHAREITAVTNQWVNSYKRLVVGLRGADLHVVGPQQPLGHRQRAAHQAGQGRERPHRVPGARPGLQPLPGLLGDPGRRPQGHRGGLRAPPTRPPPTSTSSPRRSGWPRASTRCRSRCRGPRRHGGVRAGAEALGEHVFEWFIRNKRKEWMDYKTQVTQFELDRYLPTVTAPTADGTPARLTPTRPRPSWPRPSTWPGYPWKAVADERTAVRNEPGRRVGGAVIVAADDPEGAFALCRALRKRDVPLEPLLLLVSGGQLADLELRDDLFDDFCLYPFQPLELEARLKHLFWRTGRGTRPELVEYGALVLNLETYQAAIDGARSTSPTWSTSCSSSSARTPAGCSPGRRC